jgi:PBSX family phage terminase large subunit
MTKTSEIFDPVALNKAAKQNDEFVLNPIFEPLFDDHVDQHMYYQCYGGRGSGKSTAVAIAMVELTYSDFGHDIMYLRATMSSMDDSSIKDIRSAIKDLGLSRDFKENRGRIINKKTGSTISFKGMRSSGNATANLKSLSGVTTVVFEEAEEVGSFAEWSKVDEGIRKIDVPLKIIMIYNPGSALSSWIHEEWFVDGKPNPERFNDTVFMHSTYHDNIENLNPKKVAQYERLKVTNPIYYRNTILAEWTLDAQERIYPDWEEFNNDLLEKGDEWYGMDFGYGGKDSTAVTKFNWIDGKYYAQTVFEESGQSIRKTLAAMKKGGIPYNAKIYCDHMPLLISEIRDGGYKGARKCKKGKVEEGIKKVQDKDIVIVGGKKDPLYYHHMTWSRTDGKLKEHEPDALASLRYGIISHTPNKYPNGLPKKKTPKTKGGFIGDKLGGFAGQGGRSW